ncbi:hypothetical protein ACWGI9_44495 [Streptomyces sp. NPDC054833]
MTRCGYAIKALPNGCKPSGGKDIEETDDTGEATLDDSVDPGAIAEEQTADTSGNPPAALQDPSAPPQGQAAPSAEASQPPDSEPAADILVGRVRRHLALHEPTA